ncbi:MAG: ABC transporter ATP-binding protein [Deferribacteraceae bacterium]|jgi:lipoprotein-releasing system ATP-binding protein|nr:ABC transporter ATP-binding protein [Deferribacteraceae bacterium]
MIELKNITKSYGSLQVLNGINLTINKGEVLAITGQSGAGKSTLMHIIGGLDRPTSGEVLFDGTDIYKLNSTGLDRYRNEKIGFVFQFHYLLDDFSAVENIMIPSLLAGKGQTECKDRAIELLKSVGLADRATHHPKELSGGEQQRVAVARALMNNPSMILADEPTGNLDRTNSDIVQEMLFGLKSLGVAVVIVTHDTAMAAQCERTIHLEKA